MTGNRDSPAGLADAHSLITHSVDPKVRSLYERSLVLVRPDGHVAWRSDAIPSEPLALVDRVTGR